ncbi:hypothetical protein MnTg04_00639 [bacterium MnTg04]|nr:hypothetical protein MnTg04_00639 [bacterium MnTg04]
MNPGAQQFGFLTDLESVAAGRALTQHGQREAGGTELAAGVGGIARIKLNGDIDYWHRVAFGQYDLDTVFQPGTLYLREFQLRHDRRIRNLAAIGVGCHRLVVGKGEHVEPVVALL